MAQILDGKALNEKIAEELAKQIRGLTPKPKLIVIQVGDLPESNAYIGRKIKFGEKIGAAVDLQKFPNDVTQEKLQTTIYKLNTDTGVTGIIVQMPIAKHLNKDEIIEAIDPKKDVDGLTSKNLKLLWENKTRDTPGVLSGKTRLDSTPGVSKAGFIPATTKGVLTLLNFYKIPISRQKVVIVGRSSLVGKPTMLAFLNNDATVTVCHKATKNLPEHTKAADILVVATGKPNLIGKEHVSRGQVVIDVGINAIEGPGTLRSDSGQARDQRPVTKLIGDVNFAEVAPIVAAITPVPGGIGPMTVASLFQNLLQAYKNQE